MLTKDKVPGTDLSSQGSPAPLHIRNLDLESST